MVVVVVIVMRPVRGDGGGDAAGTRTWCRCSSRCSCADPADPYPHSSAPCLSLYQINS